MEHRDIHVVIPCYNEADRLAVEEIGAWLSEHRSFHFLFVDDGSRDGTLEVVRSLVAGLPTQCDVMRMDSNLGKGEAVRRGILNVLTRDPEVVGYFDADLSTPLWVLPQITQKLIQSPEIDLVLAARVRLLGADIQRKAIRHYAGRVYATVASWVLDMPVYDTQCGAKLIRINAATRHLFERPFFGKWTFDVELLARYSHACSRLGKAPPQQRIVEYPLPAWHDVEGSKTKPLDFFTALWQLGRIHRQFRVRGLHRFGSRGNDTISKPLGADHRSEK